MTEPGYQGVPTPDPNAPQAPQSVPGQYVPPAGAPTPPAPGTPPPGYANSEEKTWALVAHFGGALGSLACCGVLAFVAPLVAFLVKGSSPTVRQHALAALNFQIPVSAAGFIMSILYFVAGGFIGLFFGFLGFLVLAVGVIFGILGGIKANEGQVFKYPLGLSLIK